MAAALGASAADGGQSRNQGTEVRVPALGLKIAGGWQIPSSAPLALLTRRVEKHSGAV